MIQGDKIVWFYCFAVSEPLFLTSSLSLLPPSALSVLPLSLLPLPCELRLPGAIFRSG